MLNNLFCHFKGKTPEFINQDDQSRRWLNDFRTKPFAVPLSLEVIDRKFHINHLQTGFGNNL
jgi:hypothetical protein